MLCIVLRLYGQLWDLQIFDWNLELLESSYDLNIVNEIQERIISLPKELESGRIFFVYIIMTIVSLSEDAIIIMIILVRL